MSDAWDFGPGDQSAASMTWQDFSTGVTQFSNAAVQTVGAVTNTVNGITQALGGTTTPAKTSTQPAPAPKSGLPWWFWAIGGYFLLKEIK